MYIPADLTDPVVRYLEVSRLCYKCDKGKKFVADLFKEKGEPEDYSQGRFRIQPLDDDAQQTVSGVLVHKCIRVNHEIQPEKERQVESNTRASGTDGSL